MSSELRLEVGRRIRELRQLNGLSLSELAQRASVGKATLSELEAGTRNPTIETLYAITAQLDVPLAAVLAESGPDARQEEIHGAAVSVSLLETFADSDVTSELYRVRIRPGTVQISPPHKYSPIEYFTVFAGTAIVGPSDDPIRVPAGGHVSWISDVRHIYAAENGGEVHASLLIRQVVRADPASPDAIADPVTPYRQAGRRRRG